MDNVTHTIIGLAVGEVAIHWRAKSPKGLESNLRPLYWMSSAIANNIPDLDAFTTYIFAPGKLGYLLGHRGFTHTVGFLPLLALVTLFLCSLFSHVRKLKPSALDWAWLTGLSILGVASHIFADSWNNYGVHPFWPFNSEWVYGDFIFILEPIIWIALLPALVFSGLPKFTRRACAFLLLAILVAAWITGYVPRPLPLMLTVITALGLLTKTLPPLRRLAYAFTLLFICLGSFALTSAQAKSILRERFSAINEKSEKKDLVLTPMPANPFCWNYINVEKTSAKLILRSGVFAPFPEFFPVEACPIMASDKITAPIHGAGTSFPGELISFGTFEGSLAEYEELQKNCFASAFFIFARSPFWIKETNSYIIGDLRYDREEGLGFAEMRIPKQYSLSDCPHNLPHWVTPLAKP